VIGTLLRYYVGLLIPTSHLWGFPLGTLMVNYIGCFLLSWFTIWSCEIKFIPSWFRVGFAIGLIGSFTTFSTFSVEVVKMIYSGSWIMALLYVLLSLWGGLFLAWIGYQVAIRQRNKKVLEGEFT
jgi:CrcB protein